MRGISLLLALFVLASLGCGGVDTPSVQVQAPGLEQVKPVLESVAQTGTMDSGMIIVREELEKLKQTDAAKAEGLLKGLAELEAARDPATIKAKAKALASQL